MSESNSTESAVQYKDIPGFPGYRIGSDGNLWSCWKRGKKATMGNEWIKMNSNSNKSRYASVTLHKNSKSYSRTIHRLVIEAFVGPCPKGMECRHKDGNCKNNHLENLSWGTKKENGKDRVKHGTSLVGIKHPKAKLTEESVTEIRRMYATGKYYQKEIGEMFEVDKDHISNIVLRKSWKHI